jgi:CRP/FNR family transcriptional regulator, cyclic AMP receptor protein
MKTKAVAALIAAHPLFEGLDPGLVDYLAGCGRNVAFEPGARIFHEGAPADLFYLIRRGNVALEVHDPRRGSYVFQTVGAGDVLGVSWLVPPYRWEFDARATDAVGAVAFDASCIREKCDTDPAVGYALMKRFVPVLVERLQAARLQAMDVYGGTG